MISSTINSGHSNTKNIVESNAMHGKLKVMVN